MGWANYFTSYDKPLSRIGWRDKSAEAQSLLKPFAILFGENHRAVRAFCCRRKALAAAFSAAWSSYVWVDLAVYQALAHDHSKVIERVSSLQIPRRTLAD